MNRLIIRQWRSGPSDWQYLFESIQSAKNKELLVVRCCRYGDNNLKHEKLTPSYTATQYIMNTLPVNGTIKVYYE